MPQPTIKIIIPATLKVATGHQSHISGTGAHRDKRLRRKNTRQQQKQLLAKGKL